MKRPQITALIDPIRTGRLRLRVAANQNPRKPKVRIISIQKRTCGFVTEAMKMEVLKKAALVDRKTSGGTKVQRVSPVLSATTICVKCVLVGSSVRTEKEWKYVLRNEFGFITKSKDCLNLHHSQK